MDFLPRVPVSGEYEELVMSKILNLGPGLGLSCTECEYNSTMKSNMRYHIESKHLDLSYTCSECGNTYKSYKSWQMHIQRNHR